MRIISPTNEQIEKAMEKFREKLTNSRSLDGKIKFEESLLSLSGIAEEKREVIFTADAFLKMRELVSSTSTEVAWHGLVKRDAENDAYIIHDIILYPQRVTGVTVNTDDEKYAMWLMNEPDEVFEEIRMQGHSHVRMGVTPSITDETYYETILQSLDKSDFYIFMITNKQGDMNIWIHELFNNLLFEPKDVETTVQLSTGEDLDIWGATVKDAYVETATVKSVTKSTGQVRHFGYNYDQSFYDDYLDHHYGNINKGKNNKNKGNKNKGGKK